MQPDAVAIAAAHPVPFIRIADRIGAAAVKIRELAFRQPADDVIHAHRRFLVALAQLLQPVFADGDVVVGDIAGGPAGILEHEQCRLG